MSASIVSTRTLLLAAALSCGTVACGNGSASPASAIPANVAASSKLQLGVGTATINTEAGSIVGTNFTMTFRGPDGNNATGDNTPTLTGPPSYRIGFAGSINSLRGLAPLTFAAFVNDLHLASNNPFGTQYYESLGPYVGVFGYGMAADNLVSSQLTNAFSQNLESLGPDGCRDVVNSGGADPEVEKTNSQAVVGSNQPVLPTGSAVSDELGLPLGTSDQQNQLTCPVPGFSVPLFSNPPGQNTGDPNGSSFPLNYYGGPPAWPSPQGYGAPAFFLGFGLGFMDTPAAPVPGTYTLDVAYPTSPDYSASANVTASAQLNSIVPLPVMPEPSLHINNDGSGIVSINIPPGLFESIVEVRTNDCRNSSTNQPNNYSQVLHTSGLQNVVFANNLGPPGVDGQPSETFCSVNTSAMVSVLGFDYPAYESSYPFDTSVSPKITNGDGHTGQADVTTSPPLMYSGPAAVGQMHVRKR